MTRRCGQQHHMVECDEQYCATRTLIFGQGEAVQRASMRTAQNLCQPRRFLRSRPVGTFKKQQGFCLEGICFRHIPDQSVFQGGNC